MITPTKEDLGRLVECRHRLGDEPEEAGVLRWSDAKSAKLEGFTDHQIFTAPEGRRSHGSGVYDRRTDYVEWASREKPMTKIDDLFADHEKLQELATA